MRNTRRHTFVLIIAVYLGMSSGCRVIRRFGDNRQAIAARRLSGQGFQAMHDGRWESAEDLFTEALDVSKADDRSHWGMAETCWNRGQKEVALTHMEQAVRLTAGDPKLVRRLGRMYLETGDLQQADHHSKWSLQTERGSAEGWALRGDVLKASGKLEDALAAYHRSLAYQPDRTDVQLQTAEIYQTQHRFDRSLATLDRMTDAISPDDAPARADMMRGIAMRQLGRADEALRCFDRAIQKDPHNPQSHLELAATALQLGKPEEAQIALQAAMSLNPGSQEQMNLIQSLTSQTRLAANPDSKSDKF
jgi:tetratricopeptide (TPR) repeat protein